MRILVTPERLLDLSRQIGQGAAQLRELEGRLGRALAGLDWEVRQQANVEGLVYDARNRARALAERAEGLARFLADRAHAFQQADQEASNDWDAFLAPFRTPVSTPVLTTESVPTTETISAFSTLSSIALPLAALAALVAKMKVDASGVAHVFGPRWLKELAGVSPYLTRIRPENLAKHLVRQELSGPPSTSGLANFMTVVGLIPTAIKDWQEYSGKGFTAFAGAFLVDAAIDIVVSKAFQHGGVLLSTALLTPVLGPFAPVVGLTIGSVVGHYVANWVQETPLRDKAVEITTEKLKQIGGFLRKEADGIQHALSGIFDKVIVPAE